MLCYVLILRQDTSFFFLIISLFFVLFFFFFTFLLIFTKMFLLLLFYYIYFSMKIIFIFSCSGMFRDVPECSGIQIRNVHGLQSQTKVVGKVLYSLTVVHFNLFNRKISPVPPIQCWDITEQLGAQRLTFWSTLGQGRGEEGKEQIKKTTFPTLLTRIVGIKCRLETTEWV